MPIGFIIRGRDKDLIILGDTLSEAQKEFEKYKKQILKFSLGPEKAQKHVKVKTGKKSISGQVLLLKSTGFFNKPQTTKEIANALAKEGYHYATSSLTWPLQNLVRKKELGRVETKKGWGYVKR